MRSGGTRLMLTLAVSGLLLLGFVAGLVVAAEHDDLPANEDAKPEIYATGFEFAEGPAVDVEGNLFVVNYRSNGNVGIIMPDGKASVFCDLRELVPVEGGQPQANGLKLDSQGRLIAADSGAGRLLRIAADGRSVSVLADRWEGKHFSSVNDVALDPQGNIFFSDPGGSSKEKPIGSIYRYDIRTSKVARLDTGLAFPNGLGPTPDGKHLCLSESNRNRLLIYDLGADGELSNRRELIAFAPHPDDAPGENRNIPDGFVYDAKGRLYVGTWTGGTVNVVEVPSGKLLRTYDAGGSKATNCHFHDGYLYVTVAEKEAVFRLKLGVKGFDYNGTLNAR